MVMPTERLEFDMPAEAAVVFDAFHVQRWRVQWDSLVSRTEIDGGLDCPQVGLETRSCGAGLLRGVVMRTRFLSFDRPRVAAAVMVGMAFPFSRWAASMRHRAGPAPGRSVLIYTVSFDVQPRWLAGAARPVVRSVFRRQTQRRFARLRRFLEAQAPAVRAWQAARGMT